MSKTDYVGCTGLIVCLGLMGALAALGGDGKTPFWMNLEIMLILGASIGAVALSAWAGVIAVQTRRAAVLVRACVIAAALLFLAWGVIYPSHRSAKADVALVNEISGFTDTLLSYTGDHGGRFPASLDELINGGYVQKNAHGKWVVASGDGRAPRVLRDPSWFDVAWGARAEEIGVDGAVAGRGGLLVRPAPGVAAPGFETACRIISRSIGEHLIARREQQFPDTGASSKPSATGRAGNP